MENDNLRHLPSDRQIVEQKNAKVFNESKECVTNYFGENLGEKTFTPGQMIDFVNAIENQMGMLYSGGDQHPSYIKCFFEEIKNGTRTVGCVYKGVAGDLGFKVTNHSSQGIAFEFTEPVKPKDSPSSSLTMWYLSWDKISEILCGKSQVMEAFDTRTSESDYYDIRLIFKKPEEVSGMLAKELGFSWENFVKALFI